mgnify:CR=1 FL=1
MVSQTGVPGLSRDPFWKMSPERLLRSLGTSNTGLTTLEALARLKRFGPNSFDTAVMRPLLAKVCARLLNPLIAILIVAAAVSGLGGQFASFVIIVIVIAFSLTLDVVQEHRAEQTADALRRSVAIQADAFRDGSPVAIPVTALVPGDVIQLRIGDLVPADGIVLSAQDLQVNESLLTGESFPARKRLLPSTDQLAEASNALYAGTSVVTGHGTMLVVETGAQTRFGMIAAALSANNPPTALETGVRRLGYLIVRLTLFLTLFVTLAHLSAGRSPLDSFLFAVALAVGLTPELLPMVITVTLARGAARMSARHVIVKRLSAVHDLGAMDVLCVDKTGTLTEAKISLARCVNSEDRDDHDLLQYACLNAHFQMGIRSPIDAAILQAGQNIDLSPWKRTGELAFDFGRRCLSVAVERGNETLLVTKGAPEAILARSVAVEVDGLARPLDETRLQRINAIQERYTKDGYRLLAVAIRLLPTGHHDLTLDDEADLTLLGFCLFTDPVKADAPAALAELGRLGVNLKIISGDQPGVVRHVAAAVGLPCDPLLTGAEIADLTDSGLAARLKETCLFARVDPEQKKRIINVLGEHRHVVGFVGDGVNDAPALHAAHVGLSVDTASEVARSAADMILLSPNLNVLTDGIREGRRTLANILKYVRMGTSSNFGNMLSMAAASVFLPFLPLLPLQILLNNLLYDLSEIGIPFDNVEAAELTQPHRWDFAEILRFTLIMGAISSVFDVATFFILATGFRADASLFQTAWFLESIATQILVIFLIRTSLTPWNASRPDAVLAATSLGALGAAIFLVLGPFHAWFGFTELSGPISLTVACITVAYLVAAEAGKHLALTGIQPAISRMHGLFRRSGVMRH